MIISGNVGKRIPLPRFAAINMISNDSYKLRCVWRRDRRCPTAPCRTLEMRDNRNDYLTWAWSPLASGTVISQANERISTRRSNRTDRRHQQFFKRVGMVDNYNELEWLGFKTHYFSGSFEAESVPELRGRGRLRGPCRASRCQEVKNPHTIRFRYKK